MKLSLTEKKNKRGQRLGCVWIVAKRPHHFLGLFRFIGRWIFLKFFFTKYLTWNEVRMHPDGSIADHVPLRSGHVFHDPPDDQVVASLRSSMCQVLHWRPVSNEAVALMTIFSNFLSEKLETSKELDCFNLSVVLNCLIQFHGHDLWPRQRAVTWRHWQSQLVQI